MKMKSYLWGFALSAIVLAACGQKKMEEAATPVAAAVQYDAEKVLNIYNWPDYIPEHLIANFEKETGIKVNYDTFDTNEALHAKLVAGNTGYDIVVPTAGFAKKQIDGGLYQPVDKALLSNFGNISTSFLEKIAGADAGNKYLVPWAWGFTTVGINKTKVEKALAGMPMPENAWDLVFKPEYASKLKSCGIAYLDSPTEILPIALHYVGKDAFSSKPEDFKAAGEMLAKVRPNIRLFSSTMIDDIASGKACAVVGWSGDINIGSDRAKENGSKDEIVALLPTTGGAFFGDTMAIPKDAKHVKNAHAFMNYYLRAEISATMPNELNYPNGNKAAEALVKPEILAKNTVFLDAANMAKLIPTGGFAPEATGMLNSTYNGFKKGK